MNKGSSAIAAPKEKVNYFDFFKIDGQTKSHLNGMLPLLNQHLPTILDRFYKHLGQWDSLIGKFGGTQHIEMIKGKQTEHWNNLFSGEFNQAYETYIKRIGKAHQQQDIDPAIYIGGYAYALNEITSVILNATQGNKEAAEELLHATIKAVFIDMSYVIQVYNNAINESACNNLNIILDSLTQATGEITHLNNSVTQVASTVEQAGKNIGSVLEATELTNQNIKTAEQDSQQMAQTASKVASSTEEVTSNLNTLAAAVEELSASFNEVSKNTISASTMSKQAVENANQMRQIIETLNTTANEVSNVTHMIGEIAAQTNLLALNASIQAANAGPAGKAFAVVANEVKNLANEASQATEAIKTEIQKMQSNTDLAVSTMTSTSQIIDEMSMVNNSIAAAAEEQSMTSREISGNLSKIAKAAQDVSGGIQVVANSSGQVATAMDDSKRRIQEMTNNMDEVSKSMSFISTRSGDMANESNSATQKLVDVNEIAKRILAEMSKDN